MYEIRFFGKNKKKFKTLLNKLSPEGRTEIKEILTSNPYPRTTHGSSLCKVEKKGPLYCIEVSGGDRILYDIINKSDFKVVIIRFAGNHDEEITYLRRNHRK